MMRLRTTVNSPFGRKIRAAAAWLGLDDRIALVGTNYIDPADPIHIENPLGKMPVLTLDDGTTLFDSRVILEYLDMLGGGRLVPAEGPGRWAALRLQALADGIMDAGVLIVMQARHQTNTTPDADWTAFQRDKLVRGFAALAADLPDPRHIDVGTIAAACMLEWVEIRKPADWRSAHPPLADWLQAFNRAAPFFAATAPVLP